MSQYGTIYKSEWLMADDTNEVQVRIFDTEHIIDDADTPTVYDLKPSGQPLVMSVINNGRSKFGIFAKQARMEFLSTQSINAYTFVDSTDQRWYVEIKVNDTDFLFKGFLVLSETSRPFLPNPQVIGLIASDNLALLSERDLLTDADAVPTGKNRIADYIAWCLKRTGLNLPFKVVNNIKPGTGTALIGLGNFSSASDTIFFPVPADYQPQFYVGQRLLCTSTGSNNGTVFTVTETVTAGSYIGVSPTPVHESGITNFTLTDQATGHLYDKIHLDAKTFEAEIGECEDCRAVLEKILDKNCFLTQYKGEWWIISPDEINDLLYYIAEYDEDGAYISTGSGVSMAKEIGDGGIAHWIERSQLTEYDRPYKFTKHTFRYDYPKEIPCNVDFSRGDLVTTVSATQKQYELTCWTIKNGYTGSATSITPYIEKRFSQFGYENQRYAVLPSPPDSTFHYIESEGIKIEIKDRFSVSIDFKTDSDITGSGSTYTQRVATVRLVGDDGTYWMMDIDGTWYLSNSTYTTNFKDLEYQFIPNNVDTTEYATVSVDSKDIPTTGTMYIDLHALNQQGGSFDNKDIHFAPISFTYYPFINGSLEKFSGQSSKAERVAAGYSANLDEDVTISDSPKPILKGGMFAEHSGVYPLQPVYWSSQQWALSEPNSDDYFQPFEYHRVNGTYNQNNYCIRYFSGSLNGLTDEWPDMVHNYQMIDADVDSAERYFMMIEMEQDWHKGRWRAKFAETYNTDGKVFPPFEFKYITE